MTDSISSTFIKGSQAKLDQDQRKLESTSKEVRKGLSEFNSRFTKSLAAAKKVVGSVNDSKSSKELELAIKKAEKFQKIQERLERAGDTVSSAEASGLIAAAESLNKTLTTNKKVIAELEKQGEDVKKLDIEAPLKELSSKIGESAKDFFIKNASIISSEGLAQNTGNLALGAISPELGAISELIGLDFGSLMGSLFSSSDEEDQIQSLPEEIAQEIQGPLADEFLANDDSSTLMDEGDKTRLAIREASDNIIQALDMNQEETIIIREDFHNEEMALLDDIEDSQKGGGMFSKLFKGSALGKGISAISKIGAGAGKTAGKAGLLGVAGAAGFAIGTFINEKLLSDEIKLSISEFIGPKIESLVAFFKGVPAFLSESFDDIAEFDYKEFFNNLPGDLSNVGTAILDFITGFIGDALDPVFQFLENPLESIKALFTGDPEAQARFVGDQALVQRIPEDPNFNLGSSISSTLDSINVDSNSETSSDLRAGTSQAEVAQAQMESNKATATAQRKELNSVLIQMSESSKENKQSSGGYGVGNTRPWTADGSLLRYN